MPEWVYGLGWLAVPALAVVASLYWHERQIGLDTQERLEELRKAHADLLIMNSQQRREINHLFGEYKRLRQATAGLATPVGDAACVGTTRS